MSIGGGGKEKEQGSYRDFTRGRHSQCRERKKKGINKWSTKRMTMAEGKGKEQVVRWEENGNRNGEQHKEKILVKAGIDTTVFVGLRRRSLGRSRREKGESGAQTLNGVAWWGGRQKF